MRIIDSEGRRDYYDIGQGLGQDQGVVYLRRPQEIARADRYGVYEGFTAYTIGFCGHLYPAFHASFWSNGEQDRKKAWCHTIEECDRFAETLEDYHRDRYFGRLIGKVGKWERRRGGSWMPKNWHLVSLATKSYVSHYFDSFYAELSTGMTRAFHEHNAPIVVWEPKKILVNPLLRPYEFFRVKEPYTAFQELQQYVGGVLLAENRPLPSIDDATMQQIKGFDHRYSFRKEPKENR